MVRNVPVLAGCAWRWLWKQAGLIHFKSGDIGTITRPPIISPPAAPRNAGHALHERSGEVLLLSRFAFDPIRVGSSPSVSLAALASLLNNSKCIRQTFPTVRASPAAVPGAALPSSPRTNLNPAHVCFLRFSAFSALRRVWPSLSPTSVSKSRYSHHLGFLLRDESKREKRFAVGQTFVTFGIVFAVACQWSTCRSWPLVARCSWGWIFLGAFQQRLIIEAHALNSAFAAKLCRTSSRGPCILAVNGGRVFI